MDISLKWLLRYLDPADADADADEVEHALTYAGFPIEARRPLPGGDTFLDVEVTSNRGDCLSHISLAREVAARTGRRFVPPAWDEPPVGAPVGDVLKLDNRVPKACPRFTARVIRGVKVGPSPAWLVDLLGAVGQRPINNVVDVTNWLTLAYGNPAHVFDLGRLAGGALVVRASEKGERLTTLDGIERVLEHGEIVVADGERAQSLAGVIGGADSAVNEATTDVVLEVACWDPVLVRRASRLGNVRTDASHRFERIVDPRTLDEASRRAAALICEFTGGALCEGVLDEGAPLPASTVIDLRPARADLIIGVHVEPDRMAAMLRALAIDVEPRADVLRCTIPPFRPDLAREIDLIEEVARIHGLDSVPIAESIPLVARAPSTKEQATRRLGDVLAGLGFFEAVTVSFISRQASERFVPATMRTIEIDDERRKAEPVLRPSLLPSLLACRLANQDGQADAPGGVRLFEVAPVFAQDADEGIEFRTLALLMDVHAENGGEGDVQMGVRLLRGAIEAITRELTGEAPTIAASEPTTSAWNPDAHASISLGELRLGQMGLPAPGLIGELDRPVVCAEIAIDLLLDRYPPAPSLSPLPEYPAIERDLSLVVDEGEAWASIAELVASAKLDHLEACDFVGVYRGTQIGAGRKSVTLRLRFRDAARTLRREEVEPQLQAVTALAEERFGATLRA